MIEFLRAPAAIVLVFGLVIFVHEFGHFLAAKMMGVYAPRFSIGFGPALWSRKWGETEYMLAVFPLGGYVRMASRDDETMAFIEGGNETPTDAPPARRGRYWSETGMAPFGPRPVPADRWFESKSLPARLFILVAGVTMNFVLGYAIYTGITLAVGAAVLDTRLVGRVTPPAGAPQLAMIAPGDTVEAIGSIRIANWDDFQFAIDTLPGDSLTIRTNRAAVTVPAGAPRSAARRALNLAFSPDYPAVLAGVKPGDPAQRGGLREGDSIVAIDGAPVRTWQGMRDHIEPASGRELHFTVARGGKTVEAVVHAESLKVQDPTTKQTRTTGWIGVTSRQPIAHEPMRFGAAFAQGARLTWFAAGAVVESVRLLLTGGASVKELGGPVAIGDAAAQAARAGWETLLSLLAFISINVAVFNLLPVPVLDGGQIMIVLAERVKGGALSLRTRENLMRVGLVLVLLLLIVVMYNDISARIRGAGGP